LQIVLLYNKLCLFSRSRGQIKLTTASIEQYLLEGLKAGSISQDEYFKAYLALSSDDRKQKDEYVSMNNRLTYEEFFDIGSKQVQENNHKLISLRAFCVTKENGTNATRAVLNNLNTLYQKVDDRIRYCSLRLPAKAYLFNSFTENEQS